MKVIFLSTFKFPNNDAGSLRYSFLSKLFKNKGYIPYFVGKGETSINVYTSNKYGFYTSLKSRKNNLFFKALDTLIWFEKKIIKEIKKISTPNDIIVITCFFSKTTNKKIINFAKKKNIKVLFAIEEKFSKSEFRKLDLISLIGFRKCKSFYKNIQYYNKPIIAISSYIGEFAKKANVPYIVIPFVYDEDLTFSIKAKPSPDLIRFFYAGTPGKKDLLLEMIKGFDLLPAEYKNHIKVDIYGISNEYATFWLSKELYENTKQFIKFYGLVGREQINNDIINYNFSILLRNNNEEFAKAGFPTKIAESLFYGVPVITNLSSDLELYLIDRFNSIIVEGYTEKDFCEAVKAAVDMSHNELMQLKKNARETSIKSLTTSSFVNLFNDFLSNI